MIQLYLGFLLLLALAMLLAARTAYLRGGVTPANETRRNQNVELYRLHLTDLERQHERGEIDGDQLTELREDLQRNLLAEIPVGNEKLAAAAQGRGLLWLVVVLVPLIALPLYFHVGAGSELKIAQALDRKSALQQRGEEPPEALYQQLHRALERQVERQPESIDYLVVAARLALEAERPQDAERYYRQALTLIPDNPALLLEWSQARFAATSRVDDDARHALQAVLQADPMNRVALEMLGIHAFQTEQFEQALHYWGIALRQSSPESDRAQALWHGIQQARGRLGEDGYRIPTRVTLDAALTADSDAVVFLAVRRQGSSIPVLAQRHQVRDLPLEVTLDNSMGMLPGNLIDANGLWEVVARISEHGSATPASGDLEGLSAPLSLPLAESVEIVIDTRRP